MTYEAALLYQAAHLNATVIAVAEYTGNLWLLLHAVHR